MAAVAIGAAAVRAPATYSWIEQRGNPGSRLAKRAFCTGAAQIASNVTRRRDWGRTRGALTTRRRLLW